MTTGSAVISLSDKLATFSDHWNPRIVANYNGNEVRIAKLKGGFDWHSHSETDEMFMVLHGELDIQFRDRTEHLNEGQILVVPKGVEHRPVANEECHVMFMDREGEPNTGVNPSDLTRAKLEVI